MAHTTRTSCASLSDTDDAILYQGLLTKQGRVRKSWKERYFELRQSGLRYFARSGAGTEKQIAVAGALKGELAFVGRDISVTAVAHNGDSGRAYTQRSRRGSFGSSSSSSGGERWCFEVSLADMQTGAPERRLLCAASSAKEASEWIAAIDGVQKRAATAAGMVAGVSARRDEGSPIDAVAVAQGGEDVAEEATRLRPGAADRGGDSRPGRGADRETGEEAQV